MVVKMNNNKFDYMIPKLSKLLRDEFLLILSNQKEFQKEVDTAPLLNMTLGVFTSSLINVLDAPTQSAGE